MAKNRKFSSKGAKAAWKASKVRGNASCSALQGDSRPSGGLSAQSAVRAKTPAKNGSQTVGGNGADLPAGVAPALARILRPGAAQRWTLPMLSTITPQYVEQVLRAALAGSHVHQWELFDLMMDTWPELAACTAELTEGVMSRKVVYKSWEEDGEKPTPTADERKALVSSVLRRMRPDVAADENDLEDTLRDIADAWLRGTVCLEVDWHAVDAGKAGRALGPRATMFAHPSYFGWSEAGRLGLRDAGGISPLPPHKFLLGIHKARAGSAMGNALLRPLCWWWCAANFASDWLLNLAQLFGLPFRWANYDPNAPQETVDAICNMLQNMGSAGWAAFPAGTTLDLKHETGGGDKSPQGDLLDRADRYARMLILGQTMSGSQDSSKGGGKAFGAVEADVKDQRIDAAAKFVCKVVNGQLIPSILILNYGDADESPCMELMPDSEAGSEEATRDKTLSEMMPLPLDWLRAKYGVPKPGEGEETTAKTQDAAKTQDGKTQDAREEKQPIEEDDYDAKWEDSVDGQDIAAKMASLLLIDDDAIFAKKLQTLTDSLK